MPSTMPLRFTRVIPPVVRTKPKPPASLIAMALIDKLYVREAELSRKANLRLLAGAVVVAGVVMSIPFAGLWLATHFSLRPMPVVTMNQSWFLRSIAIGGIFAALILPVAIFTRNESRADAAQRIIDGGKYHGTSGNPLVQIMLVLLMVGLLYGEFLIIDGIKARWVAFRLRNVDRRRAALVVSQLLIEPRGLDPRLLLRVGESPLALRRLMAYLILNEWADISKDGTHLQFLSTAKKALRA